MRSRGALTATKTVFPIVRDAEARSDIRVRRKSRYRGKQVMSKAPLISAVLLIALGLVPASAGPRTISVPAPEGEAPRATPTTLDEYRGYRFNLS